jgi:hypothetical protein
MLEVLQPVAEIRRLVGFALRIDHDRQIAAQAHRIHVVEEERAVPAEQVLHIMLRRREQHVDAGLVHQAVETACVERNCLGGHVVRSSFPCAHGDYNR